ncbi:MAG: hypothetical protein JW974_02865 [Alphaproteobacteria bacterium]|nr:hypothetical protein [Alphaproteobacteria bacterium]MBN2675594.1 hypothetical protein [Alphaproteobacteria bacterium]
MTRKRLFLFAAFDTKNYIQRVSDAPVIDDSLIVYVRALSELGDIVVYMDNNTPESEMEKLKPYTLYTGASAHGEYDFGSYKRAYIWACNNLNLSDYDWMYLVNDSMYAPLHPIKPVLENLESNGTDANGIVFNSHNKKPHLQSWFLGMSQKVFLSEEFDSFITSVEKQKDKGLITYLYEQGFTRLLKKNKWSFSYLYSVKGHAVYNNIKKLFINGMPFMKKTAFTRHMGSLGNQVFYIMNNIDSKLKNIIISDAKRVYCDKDIDKILTNNIFKIIYRRIKYVLRKIFIEGI